jgi:hypothetical protein
VLTVLHWNLFVASWNLLVEALNVGNPSTARFFAGAPLVAAVAVERCREHADTIDFGSDHDGGSEMLRDEDPAPSEVVLESDPMAAFLRDAASGPMIAGSSLRNFAVALLSSLRSLMRDADVPRLEAGVYKPSNGERYWANHPGLTMFRVLNRVVGAATYVHTCVVRLPDAMANLRLLYTNESVFPHVLYALKAFDTRALDLHGVLQQMSNNTFDSYGTFMFSINAENRDGVIALSTDSMQSREASPVAPPPPKSLEKPTEAAGQVAARKLWCYSDGHATLMPFLVRMPPLHLGVGAPCEPWRCVRVAFVFVIAGVSHLPRGDARAVLPVVGAHYQVRHLVAEDLVC